MAVVARPAQHGVEAVHEGVVVLHTSEVLPALYGGLWSWLTTVDHKRIGILYGVSAGTLALE
jgi:hypothetical protein